MRLKSITYSQFENEGREWRLEDLALGPVNLVVGKNASGKTRSLNVIATLAQLLSVPNKLSLLSGHWDSKFDNGGRSLRYILSLRDSKVVQEEFAIGDDEKMKRGTGGRGMIFAEKLETTMDFQAPEDELAAVNRQDSIQHSFLEPLHTWGDSVHHYPFSGPLGKDRLALFSSEGQPFNPRDKQQVALAFRRGEQEFGDSFKKMIINDMSFIGYHLDDIKLAPPLTVTFQGPIPGELVCLCVKEKSLSTLIDQNDISQGMFRVLSMLVQTNYSAMASQPGCIIVDDIGEGLDFERSCALIELLMRKALDSQVQLIMSTNDRFVMNKVPLESWTLLQRDDAARCLRVYNYENSAEIFDEFKFTGLNNFDFFAKDFINEDGDGQQDEETRDLR